MTLKTAKARANNRAHELPLFPFLSSFCPQGFHSTPIISHYSSFSFFLFSLPSPSVDPLYSYPLDQVVPVKVENNIHYYNHLCLVLSQMYNLKVIKHYELVCLQYVIHCKNTKLSMRIYKHHQGSTRIYKLHNFPPPKSLFE